jgi:KUP system potassium uptake protein
VLTLSFRSSDRLAGAYGTAVATTMLLTTVLLYDVMRKSWRWSPWKAVPVFLAFLVVDVAFFGANLLKIRDGGWIPLLLASVILIVMTTWHSGITAVHRAHSRRAELLDDFLDQTKKLPTVPGTAVFLTRMQSRGVPPLITEHVAQFHAVPEAMIALSVQFTGDPRVRQQERLTVDQISDGFWHLGVQYGFVEVPNLPAALRGAEKLGCKLPLDKPIYFAARDSVVRCKDSSYLWHWQQLLFAFMYRNAVHAADRFSLPADSLVEISRRVEV